ncbi:MAG: L-histidine N(alpha)-methyltransferase [Alphaproteobacteria bacterium]|nr:L-histidine N(alpha)-methyltransferase [Alphaproteobacteria bacterium]MCB9696818.1 L-histidine N(alpha)-methyltransferase [Alphaproteobacteria bacterium]
MTDPTHPVLAAVAQGLGARHRTLPPWLFYDRRGSELFERITELPEYYLTRAEREILETRSDDIVRLAASGAEDPLHVVELGAGSATKTQLLLRAVVRLQGACTFLPVDVSEAALDGAVERLDREEPGLRVRPVAGTHHEALPVIGELGPRRLVLFLGSSIGNHEDEEAVALLSAVAEQLAPGGCLLLGTDRRKDPAVLLPAYDDAQGVTAAFNLNLLHRLRRELGADFDVSSWRHEARWNDAHSRVEMHLVSTVAQVVTVPGAGSFHFEAGESIHTESSIKYARPRVERLLRDAGFEPVEVLTDANERFDLHLARRVQG